VAGGTVRGATGSTVGAATGRRGFELVSYGESEGRHLSGGILFATIRTLRFVVPEDNEFKLIPAFLADIFIYGHRFSS
jgi:hypothetical protein